MSEMRIYRGMYNIPIKNNIIMKKQVYDLYYDKGGDIIVAYAGDSQWGTPVFEVLEENAGVTGLNVKLPDYKPIHGNTYWSFKEYEDDLQLISRRRGRRPNKRTIDKLRNKINKDGI